MSNPISNEQWKELAAQEAWQRAQGLLREKKRIQALAKYQNDPVAFCTEVIGGHYTDEVIKVMESVRDNRVTIARSANAVGKSYAAARIAIWFYRVFDESKVYVTAAPPLENLKQILFGNIMSVVIKQPDMFADDKVSANLFIKRSPQSFIAGVAIPTSGTAEEREAKFCADAQDTFELYDGSVVTYADLNGQSNVPVVSINQNFEQKWSTADFFDNGVKPVYAIELEDGQVLRRTYNHPFYAAWDIRNDFHVYPNIQHKNGQIRPNQEGWKEVGQLSVGDALLCPLSTKYNFGNESADETLLKFVAYMIGDGCFMGKNGKGNRLQFTQADNPQLSEFIGLLDDMQVKYSKSKKSEYNWTCISFFDKRLTDFAREWGLFGKRSESKFIPAFINLLNKEQIALFLNRLFSTDGWASLSNKAEIGYTSKSKQLVLDIQRLLRRFGIRAKIASAIKSPTYDTYWILTINHANDICLFAEQIGIYGKEEAVERCREYSDTRQWFYANWKFEKPGYVWKKIRSIHYEGERPTVGVHVPGDHTYLTSVVEHNSGKHAPHLLFIVDEGDAVPDEVYKGIESCMSGEHERLLIMFNPRSSIGPVYQKELLNQANVVELSALSHPNVTSGKNFFPGAVTRSTTVARINKWTRPVVKGEKEDSDCWMLPDFLVGETAVAEDGTTFEPLQPGLRKVIEPQFWYMVLGRYPAQSEQQLISRAWVDAARSRYDAYVAMYGNTPPALTQPIMGLDIAELGADSNVCCLRYGGYVPPLLAWQGMDVDKTAIRGLELYRQHNARVVMVDGTGVGSSVAPAISRMGRTDKSHPVRAVSVKVANKPSPHIKTELGEFYQLRDQLYWAVREWLRTDSGAMLPPDKLLIDELCTPLYNVRENGKIKVTGKDDIRDTLKRSCDRFDALALTFLPLPIPTIVTVNTSHERNARLSP